MALPIPGVASSSSATTTTTTTIPRKRGRVSRALPRDTIVARDIKRRLLRERQINLDVEASGRLTAMKEGEEDDVAATKLVFYPETGFFLSSEQQNGRTTVPSAVQGCVILPQAPPYASFDYHEALLPIEGEEQAFVLDRSPGKIYKGRIMKLEYFGKGVSRRMALIALENIEEVVVAVK